MMRPGPVQSLEVLLIEFRDQRRLGATEGKSACCQVDML